MSKVSLHVLTTGLAVVLLSLVWESVANPNPAPSPLTNEELEQIRKFAANAMTRRQVLNPRLNADSQGSFSHYYGRRIPSGGRKPDFFAKPFHRPFDSYTSAASIHNGKLGGGVPAPYPEEVNNFNFNFIPNQNQLTQSGPAPSSIFSQAPQFPQAPQFSQAPVPNQFLQPIPQQQLILQPQQQLLQQQQQLLQQQPQPLAQQQQGFAFGPVGGRGPFPLPTLYAKAPGAALPPGAVPISLRHQQQLQAVMAQQHLYSVAQQQQQQQQGQIPRPIHQQGPVHSQGPSHSFFSRLPIPHFGRQQRKQRYFPKKPKAPIQVQPTQIGLPVVVPHNRPTGSDEMNIIQQHLQPQDFAFTQVGLQEPVAAGPANAHYPVPIRFEQVQQMPYVYPAQPQPLHAAMVLQSQEFPNYNFHTQNFLPPQNPLQPQNSNSDEKSTSAPEPSTTPQPSAQAQSPNQAESNERNQFHESSFSSSEQQQQQQQQQRQQQPRKHGRHEQVSIRNEVHVSSSEDRPRSRSQGRNNFNRVRSSHSNTPYITVATSAPSESIEEVIFESARQPEELDLTPVSISSTEGQGGQSESVVLAPLVFSEDTIFSTPPPPSISTSIPHTHDRNLKNHKVEEIAQIEYFKEKETNNGESPVSPTLERTTSISSSSSVSVSGSGVPIPGSANRGKRLRKVKVTKPDGKEKVGSSPK